jgi:hypothetical protein
MAKYLKFQTIINNKAFLTQQKAATTMDESQNKKHKLFTQNKQLFFWK